MIVLLVEDEPLTAVVLQLTLQEAGHQVRGPAGSATTALRLAEIDPAPAVAIVDINLRDGRGAGIGLARDLLRRDVVPLFVSAQAIEAARHRHLALGFVGKPYDPLAVLRSVEFAGALLAGDTLPVPPRGLMVYGDPRAPGA